MNKAPMIIMMSQFEKVTIQFQNCCMQLMTSYIIWAETELIIRMIYSPPLDPNKSGIIISVMEKWNHYVISRSQCCPAYPGLSRWTGEDTMGCCTFPWPCWCPQGFVPGITSLSFSTPISRTVSLSILEEWHLVKISFDAPFMKLRYQNASGEYSKRNWTVSLKIRCTKCYLHKRTHKNDS